MSKIADKIRRASNPWFLTAVIVDLVMMVLILINLGLIIFDWLFAINLVQQLLSSYTPSFFAFYQHYIHAHFTEIDLAFVSIYITEFTVQWAVAIWRKRYHRWFFYPFIHWYDLLGCIPVGSFRWLRVLRVISIAIRLHKLELIDLRETYIGATAIKYYQVLVEEISDRVVINVLNGAQREITQGSPVLERVEKEVLVPHKTALLNMASNQITSSVAHAHQQHRDELGNYLGTLAQSVLQHSSLGRQLHQLPIAGKQLETLINRSTKDFGLALVDELTANITDPSNRHKLNQVLDSFLQGKDANDAPLTPLLQEIIFGIIEQVKTQIAVQNWKLDKTNNDNVSQA